MTRFENVAVFILYSRINTTTFSNLVILYTYPPMKMEQTECFETSAYKILTPGNYPEESIQHSEHGESLKSRISQISCNTFFALVITNIVMARSFVATSCKRNIVGIYTVTFIQDWIKTDLLHVINFFLLP